jgi:hypothetical protein
VCEIALVHLFVGFGSGIQDFEFGSGQVSKTELNQDSTLNKNKMKNVGY